MQPTWPLAIEPNDHDNDSFDTATPKRSDPNEDGEQTMQSIEVARRGVEGRGLSRGSFGDSLEKDRLGHASALAMQHASKFSIYDSMVLSAMDEKVDEDSRFAHQMDLGSVEKCENLIGTLTEGRGGTEDLRQILLENADQGNISPRATEPDQRGHIDAKSRFVLNIPVDESRNTSVQAPETLNALYDGSLQSASTAQSLDEDSVQSEGFISPLILGRPMSLATMCANNEATEQIVRLPRTMKPLKNSRYGIAYRRLPRGATKSIVNTLVRSQGNRRSIFNKGTLNAIIEAGDLFLEQLSGDLEMFANHAGRKIIEETDVVTVMNR